MRPERRYVIDDLKVHKFGRYFGCAIGELVLSDTDLRPHLKANVCRISAAVVQAAHLFSPLATGLFGNRTMVDQDGSVRRSYAQINSRTGLAYPRVAQGDGTVEHRLAGRVVVAISDKEAKPFELQLSFLSHKSCRTFNKAGSVLN